jgi:hypothetical protein
MTFLRKRWLLIPLAVLLCLIALVLFANYQLQLAEKGKMVHPTTATVTGKELFRCEEKICIYTSGYGDRVEMKPGETQQRVYYQIDNFNQLDEPLRGRVVQAEKERIAKFGTRFTYSVDWYDSVGVGDKIRVGYRAFSDGQIQVWTVSKN